MRNLLLELRPNSFAVQPLEILLQQLIKAIQGRAKLKITTTITTDQPLPDEVKLVFYRITQESLNNIIKHAQATEVFVTLHSDAQEMVLSIIDNGRGFDPMNIPSGHLGIGIMKERAESIGATFYLNSYLGQGTEIVLRLG
jgi:signal transduction histidine kinase